MTALDLYYRHDAFLKALRIRMIEEAIAEEYPKQEMRCPVHLSIGQEMNAVAIANSLTNDDTMVSTHRGHAHYLAKGGSIRGLIGELYGKNIGCSRGNGGSMHLVDRNCGFLGSTSIVGGTIPIGVGAAWAAKIKKKSHITAVCIGDAAIEEGVFHESANFASLHGLRVIFFMENNNYSCFTKRSERQPNRERGFKSVAEAHGLRFLKICAHDYYPGFRNLQNAIKYMRDDKFSEPLFVECDAYRFVEHCGPKSDDHLNYRPPEEIEAARKLDPIDTFEKYLMGAGFMDQEMLEAAKIKIKEEIDRAFDEVVISENPMPSDLGAYLYA